MQEKRKTFTIYSQKLAGILLFKGFVLANIGYNEESDKKVFYFFDSDELQDTIKEYGKYSYTLIKEIKANDYNSKKEYRTTRRIY